MNAVWLFRIVKKVSPLQPVFRFRLFSCKTSLVNRSEKTSMEDYIHICGYEPLLYKEMVTQHLPTAPPCLQKWQITASFQTMPYVEHFPRKNPHLHLFLTLRLPQSLPGLSVLYSPQCTSFHKCFLSSCLFLYLFLFVCFVFYIYNTLMLYNEKGNFKGPLKNWIGRFHRGWWRSKDLASFDLGKLQFENRFVFKTKTSNKRLYI